MSVIVVLSFVVSLLPDWLMFCSMWQFKVRSLIFFLLRANGARWLIKLWSRPSRHVKCPEITVGAVPKERQIWCFLIAHFKLGAAMVVLAADWWGWKQLSTHVAPQENLVRPSLEPSDLAFADLDPGEGGVPGQKPSRLSCSADPPWNSSF